MYHSFFSRSEFQECTEFFDADDFSCKYLSCFEVCGDDTDHIHSFCHLFFICSADGYCTIICDVDLHTSLFDDGVDGLSSLTNYITDLLWINVDL